MMFPLDNIRALVRLATSRLANANFSQGAIAAFCLSAALQAEEFRQAPPKISSVESVELHSEFGKALEEMSALHLSPENSILWIEKLLVLNHDQLRYLKQDWNQSLVDREKKHPKLPVNYSRDAIGRLFFSVESEQIAPAKLIEQAQTVLVETGIQKTPSEWAQSEERVAHFFANTNNKYSKIMREAQSPEQLIEAIENLQQRPVPSKTSTR